MNSISRHLGPLIHDSIVLTFLQKVVTQFIPQMNGDSQFLIKL